ncbi:recombinase family protein [Bradyrhizobium barranii subsp. barranii]|uniref:Recombinase family protein n=1 Tax=Bradyrhizobium barranii subsp. barranii TaxID=2823807 RepID=A0A7Z0TK66_9BRAD|nr:recombinase family protein [Bradyrhizobium barranii]UGX96768.1 recombinase family protein [Bradyrhizobium barranii subsp. barranii]
MSVYGYARVSTKDQNLDAQLEALKAAGCSKILQEKISGKNREDRPALEKALSALKAGDVLIVLRLDRLARSSRDLLNIVDQISKAGASFKSIKDTWCDTTTAHGRLIMTVLAGLAEFERELLIARTSDGRERALDNGVAFGRKPKLTHHQRQEAIKRRASGETIVSIAKSYNVHHSMISRLVG